MGISGLLQFIRDASEPISVKKYKGQAVAVDTYCWLHKGAFACAEKLAKGEPTDQYVTYCMKFVDMLLTFSVKPILVFDGRNLPSKKEVEKARRERRQANLQRGKQLLREGKVSEARECFSRSVNITPDMAHHVIQAARARSVDCIVAPYEADAQLAFLNKAGIAQAVITEDSDLLAFGCKKVILKMDKMGNGLEVDQQRLGVCKPLGDAFTEEKFRYMCILSGCDYLASIHGIGLGKACKLLRMANNPDILKVIRKMGQYLKMNVVVSDEYVEGFVKANNTFLYQLVFDPVNRQVVPLNPYPGDMDPASLGYAGVNVGDEKGLQMALGNLHINTMEVIDDFNPDTAQPCKHRSRGWNDRMQTFPSTGHSIWSRRYQPAGATPAQRPVCQSPARATTRGRQRVISVEGLKLKRPREDSGVTEENLLSLYSSPSTATLKKPRREENRNATQPSETKHVPRNRFATLLQRRNQEHGGAEQETRSRFFCSSSDAETPPNPEPEPPVKPELPQTQPRGEEEEEEEEGEAKPELTASVSHTRGGRGVFKWSRTPSLHLLQQFQRQTESVVQWSQTRRSPSPSPSPPDTQDSAYFSQPNRHGASQELNSSQEWSGSLSPVSDAVQDKASGLSRARPGDRRPAGVRPCVAARASGLRKRGKQNNENKAGLQTTISSLWKNFSFRRNNPKPMSPVKDNIPTATPETNKDILFQL